jgi:hypothetical protein
MSFGTFGPMKRGDRRKHRENITLGAIRSAVIRNRHLMLGTSKPQYWFDLIKKEFPNIPLRMDKQAVYINES